MYRLRIWLIKTESQIFTSALLTLCVASIMAPPVLGRFLQRQLGCRISAWHLPDLGSNLLVVAGSWMLLVMVATTTGLQLRWNQHALVVLITAAMVVTYAVSPRLHQRADRSLLSATGSGAEVYIGLYGLSVVYAAVRVMLLARVLWALADHGATSRRVVAALTVAAALAAIYGGVVASFAWFDADNRVGGLGISYIDLSWWMATVALIALAVAGVTGVRKSPVD